MFFFYFQILKDRCCGYLRTADNGGQKEARKMTICNMENEEDLPISGYIMYPPLELTPEGKLRLADIRVTPGWWQIT